MPSFIRFKDRTEPKNLRMGHNGSERAHLEVFCKRQVWTFRDQHVGGPIPNLRSLSLFVPNIGKITETAVTKVYNDMLLAADSGQVTSLCLLDLSAAFDTVDHDLLLLRLERQFGIRGVVLQWFRSYLHDRSYRVIYGGSTSAVIIIVCSVPQGSVLGPRLFIMYTADLSEVVKQHDVNINVFADDTQLYQHSFSDEMAPTVARLERCLRDVSHWMSANRLKLNPDKTELLWAGSKHNQSSLDSR